MAAAVEQTVAVFLSGARCESMRGFSLTDATSRKRVMHFVRDTIRGVTVLTVYPPCNCAVRRRWICKPIRKSSSI
jgi:hypothetical protein